MDINHYKKCHSPDPRHIPNVENDLTEIAAPYEFMTDVTSSEKSEMLQTYILSLAANYHPHELSFYFLLYKGRSISDKVKNLPHVIGITSPNENKINRELALIISELKRREAVLLEHKIYFFDHYIESFRVGKVKEPMPRLLIILDDFAELEKEHPDFAREIVSASHLWRRVGAHFILATRNANGTATEHGLSNAKANVSLRVPEKASTIGHTETSETPYWTYENSAGRGYFQFDNDKILQLRWLDTMFEPCTSYKDEDFTKYHGIEAVSNVWLPPLPKTVYLSDLPYVQLDSKELSVPIGLLDDPVNREQRTAILNFTQTNHTLIVSSKSGGKTTLLQTILYGLVTTKSSAKLDIYIADYNSRTLEVFGLLPHVSEIVFDDNPDKANKLVALLMKELASRKLHFSSCSIRSFKEYSELYDDVPAILFAVDNLPLFLEINEEQTANIIQLTREAADYGIYLIGTCTNHSYLPYLRSKVRQNIRFGIGIQLPEKYDYDEVLCNRGELVPEEGCPGRGLIKVESGDRNGPRSLEFHVAMCLKAENEIERNRKLYEMFANLADIELPIACHTNLFE